VRDRGARKYLGAMMRVVRRQNWEEPVRRGGLPDPSPRKPGSPRAEATAGCHSKGVGKDQEAEISFLVVWFESCPLTSTDPSTDPCWEIVKLRYFRRHCCQAVLQVLEGPASLTDVARRCGVGRPTVHASGCIPPRHRGWRDWSTRAPSPIPAYIRCRRRSMPRCSRCPGCARNLGRTAS